MQSDHFPDDDPMLPRTRCCSHDVISPIAARYLPEDMEVRRCGRCGELAVLDVLDDLDEPLRFWRALVFVLAATAVAGVAAYIGFAVWGRA